MKILLLVAALAAVQAAAKSQAYDVTDYGAVCDGTTYDDAAINKTIVAAAANKSGQINFPAGTCRIGHSINLTNIPQGLVLHGQGRTDIGLAAGTRILGETGGVMVDLTGSSFVTIEQLTLFAGSTNPSTIGVLDARSAANIYSQFNVLRNITIKLPDIPSANGGHGTVGVYNYAAEIFDLDEVYAYADTPVVVFNDNLWSLSSPNTTIIATGPGHQQSTSVVSLRGSTTLWARGGPALALYNVINVNLYGAYLNSTTNNPYPYALDSEASETTLHLDFNSENFKQLWRVVGTQRGVTLNANVNAMQNAGHDYIVLDGSSSACSKFQSSQIRVTTLYGGTHNLLGEAGGTNVCGIADSEITLEANENINLPHGAFSAYIHSISGAPVINIPPAPYGSYVMDAGTGPATISVAGNANVAGFAVNRGSLIGWLILLTILAAILAAVLSYLAQRLTGIAR
jgi:Pectate lyase superfamily protein